MELLRAKWKFQNYCKKCQSLNILLKVIIQIFNNKYIKIYNS
jgi:hypothetical protein